MNSEYEFKIVRGKASYGGNNQVKKIGEILESNKDCVQCKEMRILHCSNLVSLQGI